MYAKLFIVLALAAVALTREYPAGVHPAVCPNYPYCDTAALARYTPDGQPIPEWVYNPSILPVAPVDTNAQARLTPQGQPIPAWVYNPSILPVAPVDPNRAAAPRYPADFNPALCPNYPYCF